MTAIRLMLLLALCLLTRVLLAADLELAPCVGGSRAVPEGDGFWYQEALPYSWHRNTVVWCAAIGGDESKHWRWRVAYYDPGATRIDAIATSDANYNPTTHRCLNADCAPTDRDVSYGTFKGVAFMQEFHGPRLGIALGAYFWKQNWQWDGSPINDHEWLPPGITHRQSHGSTHLAPIAALTGRQGPVELRFEYVDLCVGNRCKSESYMPTAWRSVFVLTAGYHFTVL